MGMAAFKQGWNEIPETYGTVFLFIIGGAKVIHYELKRPEGGFIMRYKERYYIVRSNDERLKGYPKQYITDQHLVQHLTN